MTTDAVSERPASSVDGSAIIFESCDGTPISDLESGERGCCHEGGRFLSMNLTLSRSENASVCPFDIMRTFVPGEKVRSHAAYAAVVHEKPSCLALSTVISLLSTMAVARSIKYGHFWNGTAPPDTPV